MNNKNKHISIRIDDETLQRFHYVSKYEDRSASGQIMYLINNCIRDFEDKHGKIKHEEKK
jgi:predicted DNA-binding protein